MKKTAFDKGLQELLCLADEFDRSGLFAQADKLDRLIRSMYIERFGANWIGYKPEQLNVAPSGTSFTEYLEKLNSSIAINKGRNLVKGRSGSDPSDQKDAIYLAAHEDANNQVQADIKKWIEDIKQEIEEMKSQQDVGEDLLDDSERLKDVAESVGKTSDQLAKEIRSQLSAGKSAVTKKLGMIKYLEKKSNEFKNTLAAVSKNISVQPLDARSPKAKLIGFFALYDNTILRGRGESSELSPAAHDATVSPELEKQKYGTPPASDVGDSPRSRPEFV